MEGPSSEEEIQSDEMSTCTSTVEAYFDAKSGTIGSWNCNVKSPEPNLGSLANPC
jgi:hypothetical protein